MTDQAQAQSHIPRERAGEREWWIATNFFEQGGEKVLGPFVGEELALNVRTFYEAWHKPKTFAVDWWPEPSVPREPSAVSDEEIEAAAKALRKDITRYDDEGEHGWGTVPQHQDWWRLVARAALVAAYEVKARG